MFTMDLVGAVVGTGLASGREVSAFFSKYGRWSYPGILLSILIMTWLSSVKIPDNWNCRWQGSLWSVLRIGLIIVTGGGALSGSGQLIALMLPVRHIAGVGIAFSFVVAFCLAYRTNRGLTMISSVLLLFLAGMIACCAVIPPEEAAVLYTEKPWEAMVKGIAYGGFNASLQWQMMHRTSVNEADKRRSVLRAGMILLFLLAAENWLLLRHPAQLSKPMPMVSLMSSMGAAGYYVCAAVLYLASLSSLTACMRSCPGPAAVCAVVIVSMLGYKGIVDHLYPVLGVCCLMILLLAKMKNSFGKLFSFSG